jgi:hypothetical protein
VQVPHTAELLRLARRFKQRKRWVNHKVVVIAHQAIRQQLRARSASSTEMFSRRSPREVT